VSHASRNALEAKGKKPFTTFLLQFQLQQSTSSDNNENDLKKKGKHMRENGKQNANVTSQEKRGDGISSFLLNAISSYFADQITDAMWNNVFNTNTMDAIGAYLWECYDSENYNELIGAFRMMYLIHDVEMPNIISMILQSSDPELLEAFFYEFLSDFDDLKFEYKDNGDDSENK
jgi:hypothetical protein